MIGGVRHGAPWQDADFSFRPEDDRWATPRLIGPPGGVRAAAHGTDGDDTFTGTDADERYLGQGGNDTLSGGGGRDHLFGGDGDDAIDGGDGNDVIEIGNGKDVVHGGNGNDLVRLDVSDGGDVIFGGKGDDSLSGYDATLSGGAGNDFIHGYSSVLNGGSGDDTLQIFGAFLDDSLFHKAVGGTGIDRFQFVAATSQQGGAVEWIEDLSNEDTIDLSNVDADDRVSGIQSFKLVDSHTVKPGEFTISYDSNHDRTVISLYSNHGSAADGLIYAPGNHVDFSNFVL